MTRVAVIIPTVPGRGDQLADSVRSTADDDRVGAVHVIAGYETCGAAWNAGALLALADQQVTHVLFSADDLVAKPGWLDAALMASEMAPHYLPAPRLYNVDGSRWDQDGVPGTEVAFPRVPFLPRDLVRRLLPIPPIHYYSDCWVGARAHDYGWKVRVQAGFDFVHSWAAAGRIHDSEPDRRAFEALMSGKAL